MNNTTQPTIKPIQVRGKADEINHPIKEVSIIHGKVERNIAR